MQNKNHFFSKLFVILFSITILLSSCSKENGQPIPEKEKLTLDKEYYPEYLEGKKNGSYFKYSRENIKISISESSRSERLKGESFYLERKDYDILLKLDDNFIVRLMLVNPHIVLDQYKLEERSKRENSGSYIEIYPENKNMKYIPQNTTVKVNRCSLLDEDKMVQGGYYFEMTLNTDLVKEDKTVIKLRDVTFRFYYAAPYYI